MSDKRPPPPPKRIGAPSPTAPAAAPPARTPAPTTPAPPLPKPPSAEWHYAQNNVQKGPITFSQLKDIASSGRLRPTDLVWKVGMPNWAAARTVQGLFSIQPAQPRQAVAPTQPPPPQPAKAVASTNSKKVILITAGATGLCFLLCCGGLLVIGAKGVEEARATLAEADALWQSGKKTEAVAKYRGLLSHTAVVDKNNGPRIFGRLIDFDTEAGDLPSAKHLVDEAYRREILPDVKTNESAKIVLQKQFAEAAKSKAEEEQRKAKEAKKRDEQQLVHAIELSGNDLTQLLDDPTAFKGKVVCLEGWYDTEGLYLGDRLVSMTLSTGDFGASFLVGVYIPTDLPLPNIQRGNRLKVTFVCEDGKLAGNRALKIERP